MTTVSKRVGGALLVAALTWSCGGGNAEQAASSNSDTPAAAAAPAPPPLPGEAPDAWAKRVSDAYDTRKLLPKMNARPPKGIAEAMEAWDPSLKKSLGKAADGSNYAFELMTVVQRLDDIWKNDELDQERMRTLGGRIGSIPSADAANWKKALAAIQKDDISELWAVVLVSRTDALFTGPGGTLDSVIATRFLDRLNTIPPGIVSELSTLLDTAKADAALRVVENDRFFDGSGVRNADLDQGVAALKMLRSTSGGESSGSPDPALTYDVVAANPRDHYGERVRWYGQFAGGEAKDKMQGGGARLKAVFVDPSTDLRVTVRAFGVDAESTTQVDLMFQFQGGPGWVTGTVSGRRKVKITIGPPPEEKELEVPVLTDAQFETAAASERPSTDS